MKDQNCAYCMEGELVAKFGIKICDLDSSKLYLFKEQSHKGRVILAAKDHHADITKLSDEERNGYFADMNKVSNALQKAFHPDKINIGAYGDTAGHMHFHLVPKYKDEFEWGVTFAMNPDKVYLSDEEYTQVIQTIKENI
ncbi:HIT family protein [Anaerosacchariphilus polymeriproducens]|uniref:HIT family protein n=1 Tax=Anaerosacchariphilus polymeriproducens TaxID=1812858 RepID=A0A371AZ45_9FIRM|nr:HIT family protein [Anaerosacchariphilus polymeriproducens]RDU24831.1 HIT family protein [Anaerosacchariphilus polymeriproducens]